MTYTSGLVSVVGRPNTGKSTLVNVLTGEKVAITSSRPQTTRHVIRGVVHRPQGQLVLVDTPGLHKPRTLLGQRLNDEVRAALADVEVVVVTLPADEAIGPGDRRITAEAAKARKAPKVAAVTKTDLVKPDQLLAHLAAVAALAEQNGFEWAEVVPLSARTGDQVDLLVDLLLQLVPEGEAFFPEGQTTDEPEDVRVAELIREAALEGVRDELPHSLAVVVDEIVPRAERPPDRPLTDVRATMFVERPSQKAIIIGRQGVRLREVGQVARRDIEALLGVPVFLDLHVQVAKDWQRDPKQLRRLGFD
ncbi:MAG TPA: GTPase Era [Actinomycetes bacterium]|nr:GTPase Era [Actinomycetes bacterium]